MNTRNLAASARVVPTTLAVGRGSCYVSTAAAATARLTGTVVSPAAKKPLETWRTRELQSSSALYLVGARHGHEGCHGWSTKLLSRLHSTVRTRPYQAFRCLSSKPPIKSHEDYLEREHRKSSSPLTKPLQKLLPTHENIYTLPNFLTLTRLIAAPVVGYLLVQEHYPAALGLFLYAGITDLVDGWIARRWNMQTVVGTIVDPMADKALMTIVVVVLGIKGALPVPLAIIILGRDGLLGLSALYYRYISLPPPKTLARYWDFSLPSAEVKPTEISKWNTFFQLGLIGATMLELALGGFPATGVHVMGYPVTGTNALEVAWWVVGGTTIWSGLSYVGGRRGLRILSKKS